MGNVEIFHVVTQLTIVIKELRPRECSGGNILRLGVRSGTGLQKQPRSGAESTRVGQVVLDQGPGVFVKK